MHWEVIIIIILSCTEADFVLIPLYDNLYFSVHVAPEKKC